MSYSYDAWGKVTATNVAGNSTGTTLINRNPYLYRGYRYDRETGLYYLNSRYYDPETGRFINADVFVSTGQGVLGNNMFAYCLNNPATLVDYDGKAAYGACYEQEADIGGWGRFGGGGFVGGAIITSGYYIDFAEAIGEIFTASTTVIVVETVQEEETNDEQEKASNPSVDYPGNNPKEPPGENYEWRGQPPEGGDKGTWLNKKNGEQLHPDLNHKEPTGPHWDYTDGRKPVRWWRLFEDGRIEIK